jgi:hypothetical protein
MCLFIVLLVALWSGFVQANDVDMLRHHVLDSVALKELYNATKNESTSPVATDNRARFEYWQLADRIRRDKEHEKIFTVSELEYFDDLTNQIFATNSYKIQFNKFQVNPTRADKFRKVAAILAKHTLETKGVKYQQNPSLSTFDQFIEINHDISGEAIDWMIAGSMFLYYLRQIERKHREAFLLI